MYQRRYIFKNFLMALVASTFSVSCLANQDQSVVGYKSLDEPVNDGIFNFFSYACGHCNRFHPETEKLRQALKAKGHEMIDVPVMLDPSHVILSQTYFAFERLDRLKDLHEEFWHWLLFAEHKWTTTEDVNKDIIAWVKDRGITEESWVTALHHKDTLAKVEWAQKLAADYQLDGTPAIGVNGKYLTSPSMAGSNEKCVELVLELADKK